ncbi:hypothetical protein KSS87_004468 [Heliosperma pusillum]|nr:hypothetical protein KSS87_004468 [Heliosperma pusillum]
MSNPPFGNPIYSDDDFSFPIEAPNYGIENQSLIGEEITLDDYMPSSSSLPNSEYQDLSMFLDDHEEDDYPLIITGQLNSPNNQTQETNPNWVVPTEAHGIMQQASILVRQHDPIITTTTTTATTTMIDGQVATALEAGQGSSTKKLNHNAKERVRRMKLNATFLALRALLPESRRAKKRWSAPYVIDRALEYIPELQKEIEKQTLEKNNMLSVIGNKQAISTEDDQRVLPKQVHNNSTSLTVSINQVKDGEVIIQICEDKDKVGVLTTLFDKLEAEGLIVLGASSLCASQDRSCFHIHIQVCLLFDNYDCLAGETALN